jgi:hypothetical protein
MGAPGLDSETGEVEIHAFAVPAQKPVQQFPIGMREAAPSWGRSHLSIMPSGAVSLVLLLGLFRRSQ